MRKILVSLAALLFGMISLAQSNYFFTDSSINSTAIIRRNRIAQELIYSLDTTHIATNDSMLHYSMCYDAWGNMTCKKEFFYGGHCVRDSFIYIAPHTLRRVISSEITKAGSWDVFTADYTNDTSGHEVTVRFVIHSLLLPDSMSNRVCKRIYNNRWQLLKVLWKERKQGGFYTAEQYEYNRSGYVARTAFNYIGIPGYAKEYEYNPQHEIIRVNRVDSTGRHPWASIFYNDHHQYTKVIRTDSTSQEVYHFIYNPDGSLFEWTAESDNRKKQMERHYYLKKERI